MNTIGIQQAVPNLPENIRYKSDNYEECEWENMRETSRLFWDKQSLDALLEGHKIRNAGIVPDSVSVEEAFYDLICCETAM